MWNSSQTPAVSYDYVDMDYNPSVYRYNHGQSCAGIIGAAYNNSICVVGIAYDSNIGGELERKLICPAYQSCC